MMKDVEFPHSLMLPKIEDGAIFVADAHENHSRQEFWEFLQKFESGKIDAPQLFLLGDMFDFLSFEIKGSHEFAKKYIDLLEKIAKTTQVYYFEGNHDYNLKKFFSLVKVYSFENQPALFECNGKKTWILHGDKFSNIKYNIYTFFIRNHYLLAFLNLLNILFKNDILTFLMDKLKNKSICKKIENFKNIIKTKYFLTPKKGVDIILEGHYHQNAQFEDNQLLYKNFSSFACDKSYFVVQLQQGIKFTQLKTRGNDGNNI